MIALPAGTLLVKTSNSFGLNVTLTASEPFGSFGSFFTTVVIVSGQVAQTLALSWVIPPNAEDRRDLGAVDDVLKKLLGEAVGLAHISKGLDGRVKPATAVRARDGQK
jgi:hypothetical protein